MTEIIPIFSSSRESFTLETVARKHNVQIDPLMGRGNIRVSGLLRRNKRAVGYYCFNTMEEGGEVHLIR
ncbi:hypothetical protein KKE45_03215 [Patescibacteria group bacterium]|nr:hypothetical protein [Patescibacteria group bacterium]